MEWSPLPPESGSAIWNLEGNEILRRMPSAPLEGLVLLRCRARHRELPSRQGVASDNASEIRMLPLQGLRAVRSRTTAQSRASVRAVISDAHLQRSCASVGGTFKERLAFEGVREDPSLGSISRWPRKHEGLVLLDGHDQSEADRGCFPPQRKYRTRTNLER